MAFVSLMFQETGLIEHVGVISSRVPCMFPESCKCESLKCCATDGISSMSTYL